LRQPGAARDGRHALSAHRFVRRAVLAGRRLAYERGRLRADRASRGGRAPQTRRCEVRTMLDSLRSKAGIAGELLGFFWRSKVWWLVPMVLVFLVFGFLMIFAQSSALAPFIYTLF